MFCLRGWGNQVPALITIEGLDEVAKLRRQIAADLDALKPRLEELDKSLDNATRNARSYQLAKIHRQFSLRFTRIPPPFRPATPKKVNSAHYGNRLRQEAVPNTGAPLPQLVCDMRRVICVGRPMTAEMRELRDRASELISLECGEGSPGLGVCSRSHPKIDSILGWYGLASEQERSHVDVILLSRSCTRFEVELLRSRLYPHQRLIVEPGSGAFTWLLAEWDGFIERSNGLFLLTEPGSRFREPSRLGCVGSSDGWPKISVVTVSYNQRPYLESCLRSVIEQDYHNLEYIVVDACSNDGSIETLQAYERSITTLVIEPDDGQSDGISKGLGLASGDILTWVNSDDMLAPNALKRAATAFQEYSCDLVAGTCERIGETGEVLFRHHSIVPYGRTTRFDLADPLNWTNCWEKGDFFFQPEVLFTREIWNRAGGYLKKHLYWANDWDLWLRCALAGASIVRIPDVLGRSRVHAQQKTQSDQLYLFQIASILREYDDLLAALECEFGNRQIEACHNK